MQVIGFGFNKISAEKKQDFQARSEVNTNIEFTGMEKEKITLLEQDKEPIRITFKYTITYDNKEKKKDQQASINFDGYIILSTEKNEIKDIMKFWKKKEIPTGFKVPLFNIILHRCTAKALMLEQDINIPSHYPLPRLTSKPKEEQA